MKITIEAAAKSVKTTMEISGHTLVQEWKPSKGGGDAEPQHDELWHQAKEQAGIKDDFLLDIVDSFENAIRYNVNPLDLMKLAGKTDDCK